MLEGLFGKRKAKEKEILTVEEKSNPVKEEYRKFMTILEKAVNYHATGKDDLIFNGIEQKLEIVDNDYLISEMNVLTKEYKKILAKYLDSYLGEYGFKRFLPVEPGQKDSEWLEEGINEGNEPIIMIPHNTNIYARNMKRDQLFFPLSGFMYCKIKGEFVVFDPDKPLKKLRYYNFIDYVDTNAAGIGNKDKPPLTFDDTNVTLTDKVKILQGIRTNTPENYQE